VSNLFATGSAIISACGTYRYRLERECPGEGATAIIMVNPSTADAETDDATIRKLIGFGVRNRWGRLIVGNLFAFRATDVRELAAAADPIGPDNDYHLRHIIGGADLLIVAWGPATKLPKDLRERWRAITNIAQPLGRDPLSIGEPANDGHPKHPLMLAYDTPLRRWWLP
jgi:hypothetical protein